MIRTPALHRALLVVLLCSSGAFAAEGESGAHPTWEERVIHEWINRARVEPAPELADCGANCSVAERAPGCYVPKPPLFPGAGLAMAARFHSASMAKQSFFAHATPCQLRSDLASVFPDACDGSAACACAGAGSTSPGGRVARFGGSYSGEIIAAGYPDPLAAFYGWLHEPVASSAPCDWSSGGGWSTNGHRWLILTSTGSVGTGYASGGSWGRYFTADFGGGGQASRIPSGAHYPRQAPTVEFWANWYDAEPPSDARVVVGSISHPMRLARGTSQNGAWTAAVSGLGSGCHRYYFEFEDRAGRTVRHPEKGTFGIGPAATCADWLDAEAPPRSRRRTARRPPTTGTFSQEGPQP